MSSQAELRFAEVPAETVRDFWNRRPCNIRHSSKPIGTLEYFEEVLRRKYFVEPHIPGFADFRRWSGRRVLEIGCGIGTDTVNFAIAGARVVAVDFSERSLQIARNRAKVYGLADRMQFVHANAENLTEFLRPEPYDLIYSFGVIHHVPRPELAMDQIRQFARPGTVLKMMLYHRHSWKVLGIILREGTGRFWLLDQLVASQSEAQAGCPVTYSYSRRSARKLIERHGFKVVDCFVDHIFPYRVTDYVQYRYAWEWYFRLIPQSVFRGLERRFGWHICLTAVM